MFLEIRNSENELLKVKITATPEQLNKTVLTDYAALIPFTQPSYSYESTVKGVLYFSLQEKYKELFSLTVEKIDFYGIMLFKSGDKAFLTEKHALNHAIDQIIITVEENEDEDENELF
jgi:hypothetical protein